MRKVTEYESMPIIKQYIKTLFAFALIFSINCDIKMQAIAPVEIDSEVHKITETPWEHLSIAWSPDGKQLAGTREIKSTTLPLFGLDGSKIGDFASLKYHTIANKKISVSSDGEKLVFRSGTMGHLWIYSRLDESIRLLTPDDYYATDAVWSPDNNKIAYVSQYHLITINAAGGTPDTIFHADGTEISMPTWSPAGKWLAFHFRNSGTSMISQIGKISLAERELIQLTFGNDSRFYPDWSPDGKNIVFSNVDENKISSIRIVSPDGNDSQLLMNPLYNNASHIQERVIPKWSPDGSKLAMVGSNRFLWIYDLNTEQVTYVDYWIDAYYEWFSPQWMPDGNTLIGGTSSSSAAEVVVIKLQSLETNILSQNYRYYLEWDKNENSLYFFQRSGLIKFDIASQKITNLNIGYNGQFKLSPNGQYLLTGDGKIYVYNLLNGESNRLLNYDVNYLGITRGFEEPDWSPDAQKFVCHGYDSLYIFQINPDSLFTNPNPKKIATIPGRFSSPSWSSEHPVWGSRIAVSRYNYRTKENTIYLIDPETLAMKPVLENATLPCWAPDGCTLAYVRANGQIYTKQVLVDLSGTTD